MLLALEVIASRVLAPYFGGSVYVWGSLISVFLTALSVGYVMGGRLADRRPSRVVFSGIVFAAGLLIVPIPLIAGPVLRTIAYVDFGPQWGPLLGAIVLFVVPSIVMGMVSPFAVRLRASGVETMGRTAGSLYAISTVGSIAGTLLTSFVLINHLGVRTILFLMGFVLMAMAAIGFLAARRRRLAAAAAGPAAAVGLGLAWPAGPPGPSVAYARDTVYQRITIVDEGSVRYLAHDNRRQSATDLREPRRSVYAYTDYLHLPLIFVPQPGRVSLIGLGGGTVAARYVEDYPSVVMDVAEIDPEVVRATKLYFPLPGGERLAVEARDGRMHLASGKDPLDVVLMDAFVIDTTPVHLATRELFAVARARLGSGGVMAINMIGALEGPSSRFFRAIYRTLGEVFHTVYVFPVDDGTPRSSTALRNIVLLSTDRPRLTADDIRTRARALVASGTVRVKAFEEAARGLHEPPIRIDDVPTLTDDFAPLDALVAGH